MLAQSPPPGITYLLSNLANDCQRGRFFVYIAHCRRVRLRTVHWWESQHRCPHLCSPLGFFSINWFITKIKSTQTRWLSYRLYLRQSYTIGQCDTLRRWVAVESDTLWSTFCCLFNFEFRVQKCKSLGLLPPPQDTMVCLFVLLLCRMWLVFCLSLYSHSTHSTYLIRFIYCHKCWKRIASYARSDNCRTKERKWVSNIEFGEQAERTFNACESFSSIDRTELHEHTSLISLLSFSSRRLHLIWNRNGEHNIWKLFKFI